MSCSQKRIKTFKAGTALKAFTFVKFGADNETVVQCGANERCIGIFQGGEDAVIGDHVEIALPGGGAFLKVSEAVGLGKLITSTATGAGEVADAAGEFCGAVAYEAGVENDVICVEVALINATASDA